MPSTVERLYAKENAFQSARVIAAFLECSNEVQAGIGEMLAIINRPDSTDDECGMAVSTIMESLFPEYSDDAVLGIDLEKTGQATRKRSREEAAVLDDLDREEATFAERVRAVMAKKKVSQAQLAARTGVTQSAISALLCRNCRPQRSTIVSVAEALVVSPQDLWPGFEPTIPRTAEPS